MFADKYLIRNKVTARIKELPAPGLGITVIIPCYLEPDILDTLHSLWCCKKTEKNVEVIVLINHSEAATPEAKAQNHQTRHEVEAWIRKHTKENLQFFVPAPVELKKKWAGAGMARKAGMDEAIIRFNHIGNPHGIVVSLDADTLVDENYLVEIEQHFYRNPSHAGATIRFEHQKEGLEERHLQGILLYEKYMDYYKRALGFTGYPYPMYTIGSAFAVTAGAYVKRGGMNRRQAGEEFYFLQNLVQIGTVGEITSTTVYPSSRLSDRVPFGTGPVLRKWMEGETDLSKAYNFKAFIDLKLLFDKINILFKLGKKEYEELLFALPEPVVAFLKEDNFWSELEDLNNNCAVLDSFRLRFYQKFNAFKILKFLNFSHGYFYQKADIAEQIMNINKTEQKNQ